MTAAFVALSSLVLAQVSAIGTPAPSLDIRPYEKSAECGASDMQIEVVVNGVTPVGILTVELYTPSKRDFLKKESRLHRIRVPAGEDHQTVCFDIPEPGRYALAAYHDKDADRDLDQKWNRMPAEPFALSSHKKLGFGFPKFEDSAFDVGANGKHVVLDLRE
ncbi:DUF2141 domain-containing protein [Henriciella aquimarina]|uniref:DUF2141 domain-containing protein n=1 Tax=Henriciella aquimarina TaxID=545261 RepID=UPI000A06F497|nr:DUF2141 domain-containing protein [Henriciella aquimarina]